MRRIAAALAVAALAAGLGACGDDDDDGGSAGDGAAARALLDAAFGSDIETADVDLRASLELAGLPIPGPLSLRLRGPFESRGSTRLPLADWDVEARGLGERFTGRLVLAAANAFVTYEGRAYETGREAYRRFQRESSDGPQSFEAIGVEPLDWVRDARIDGEETIGGTRTTRVRGRLDDDAVLRAFDRLGPPGASLDDEELDQLTAAVREVRFTSYVAKRDRTLRGIDASIRFVLPDALRERFGGMVGGGTLTVRMRLAEIDEPVTIRPPSDAEPIERLLQRLGLGGIPLAPA